MSYNLRWVILDILRQETWTRAVVWNNDISEETIKKHVTAIIRMSRRLRFYPRKSCAHTTLDLICSSLALVLRILILFNFWCMEYVRGPVTCVPVPWPEATRTAIGWLRYLIVRSKWFVRVKTYALFENLPDIREHFPLLEHRSRDT